MAEKRKKRRTRRKKDSAATIPDKPTASLTESMKKEMRMSSETFEAVDTTQREKSMDNSDISLLSGSDDSRPKTIPKLKINERPKVYEEELDIGSVYSQSAGTVSLDSIETMKEKDLEAILKEGPPTKLKPLQKPLELVDKSLRNQLKAPFQHAMPVSDAEFKEMLAGDFVGVRGARLQELAPFGHIEQIFLDELTQEIMELIRDSPKTNVEVKVTMQKDSDGMPRARYELTRRAERRPDGSRVEPGLEVSEVEIPPPPPLPQKLKNAAPTIFRSMADRIRQGASYYRRYMQTKKDPKPATAKKGAAEAVKKT